MHNKQLINRQMTLMIHYKDMVKGWSRRTLHHTAAQTSKSSAETQPANTSSTLEWTVQNCQLRQAERESMVTQVDLETKYQSMNWARKSSPRPDKYPLQNPGSIERWSLFDKPHVMDIEFVCEWKFVNSEFCIRVLQKTLKRISRVRL